MIGKKPPSVKYIPMTTEAIAARSTEKAVRLQAENERLQAAIGRMRKHRQKRNRARLAYARSLEARVATLESGHTAVLTHLRAALKALDEHDCTLVEREIREAMGLL